MSFHTLIHAALSLPPPPPPPLSSPHAQSQKSQVPTVESAHVRGLIRIVVPWWWGTMRLARGVCRHEACQRAFKDPRPQKESRWLQELPHSWTAPVPPHTPPSAPIQTVSRKPSGGFEVEECLNTGLVHTASDHKVPADFCAMLPLSQTHFHNRLHNSCLWPAPFHCGFSTKQLTYNNQKWDVEKNDSKETENNEKNKLEITSRDRLKLWKTGPDIWVCLFWMKWPQEERELCRKRFLYFFHFLGHLIHSGSHMPATALDFLNRPPDSRRQCYGH